VFSFVGIWGFSQVTFQLKEPLHFILGPDEPLLKSPKIVALQFFEKTFDWWDGFCRALSLPFEYQDAVVRAAITLKLCQFEESGAILAAMTTSVPESNNSGRNWDYRFCWLRDSFHTVRALNRLSETSTMVQLRTICLPPPTLACDPFHMQSF
jgi:hypothetical protein